MLSCGRAFVRRAAWSCVLRSCGACRAVLRSCGLEILRSCRRAVARACGVAAVRRAVVQSCSRAAVRLCGSRLCEPANAKAHRPTQVGLVLTSAACHCVELLGICFAAFWGVAGWCLLLPGAAWCCLSLRGGAMCDLVLLGSLEWQRPPSSPGLPLGCQFSSLEPCPRPLTVPGARGLPPESGVRGLLL